MKYLYLILPIFMVADLAIGVYALCHSGIKVKIDPCDRASVQIVCEVKK